MVASSSSLQLPSDMISEILTRTTLKTLDTCKCVSKEWKQQIEDEPNFMSVYDQRSNNVSTSGFFIQDLYNGTLISAYVPFDQSATNTSSSSVGSLPCNTKILASSKGILCCEIPQKNRNYRYYVHKPTTGQWRALPNPRLRYSTEAVGMVVLGSNPLRFKNVKLSSKGRLIESSQDSEYRCEILDSATLKWRETQTLKLPYTEFIKFPGVSVFFKSSFHWLTTEDNIVAFHEPTETFRTFTLPETMPNTNDKFFYQHKKLVEFQGRLGLSQVVQEDKTVELWLAEGDPIANRVEWRKHVTIDIGRFEESFKYPRPACFSNGGIVLLDAFGDVVHYRIQDSTFSVFKLDSRLKDINAIFQFRSDLETVCFKSRS